MLLKRHVVALALIAIAISPGCEIRPRSNRDDLTGATAAAPPPPAPVAAPAASPTVAPVAAPVAIAPVAAPKPATPAPVQTVFVTSAPAPDPIATCRRRFAEECTGICNRKVNESTSNPQKRRIEHDICFGECTRAAFNRCR